MSIYRAAIGTARPGSLVVMVASRKHTYHASRSAAVRALERLSRRSVIDWRGYVWPVSSHPTLTTTELQAGHIPAGVETIAL